MSFLNFWTPTARLMCHGGICRLETRVLIERAHGRDSSNVRRDIGAIEPGSWQLTHLDWKIGATSFEKVGFLASAAIAAAGSARRAPSATPKWSFVPAIIGSFFN